MEILITPGCGRVFKYLVEKHQEIHTIRVEVVGEVGREDEDENDILLTVFSHLNLKCISLCSMWNTGDIFSCLPSTLPNLEKLVLTCWLSLSDQGLIEILNRSRNNLRELDLSGSIITGVGLEEGVNSLPNLEVLILSTCNLTDGGLKKILRLSGNKLRVLDVPDTDITGQGFKEGVSLPMLEELNLGWCIQLTDGGLKEILRLSGCKLRVIDLRHTNITGQGFKNGVKSLTMLEELNLEWCNYLTDGGLKEILRFFGFKLRVLYVGHTNITGQGFKEGVSLPMLEELNLEWCEQLTDSGLQDILSITGSRLKTVNVVMCRNLSTAVRSTLLNLYPSVTFKYDY